VESWFEDNLQRKVGNGDKKKIMFTLVWGILLCVRFPMLFELSENRWESVAGIFFLG
jgi:hypothetical protein